MQALHRRIDAFEIQLLDRPHPELTVDLDALEIHLVTLITNIDLLTAISSDA